MIVYHLYDYSVIFVYNAQFQIICFVHFYLYFVLTKKEFKIFAFAGNLKFSLFLFFLAFKVHIIMIFN